jgi:hypothetical protein
LCEVTHWTSAGVSPESAIGLSGVHDRLGIYSIHVQRGGYKPWVVHGVWVESGVCGVITVEVNAWLQPT